MPVDHINIFNYAEELIKVPKAHIKIILEQHELGLSFLHESEVLIECKLTRPGMMGATFMAQALGVKVPPLGQTIEARVSTGVLFRTIAIGCLNFDKEESIVILDRLLEEAELQRSRGSHTA